MCILDMIYRFICRIDNMFWDIVTYLVILAFVYYLMQFIGRMQYITSHREELISPSNASFARDTLYKYLASWVMGVLFIYELIDLMNKGFDKYGIHGDKSAEQVCSYLDGIFVSLLIPVELLIDACVIKRKRCPNLTCDLLIIFGFLILMLIIRFIFGGHRGGRRFFQETAGTFLHCIFCFDGYIFIDWLLFKSNGGGGNYALFSSS